MTQSVDLGQFGLQPDTFAPLRRWPTIVVYGPPGSGKSSDLAAACQDAVFFKTRETTTRPYYSWLRDQAADVYGRARASWCAANAAHSAHPDFANFADQYALDAVGTATGYRSKLLEVTVPSTVSNWAYFSQIRDAVTVAHASGVPLSLAGQRISGIVLDEATEVIRRMFLEMDASGAFKSKKGRESDWAVQDGLEAFLIDFAEKFRAAGVLLGMVCAEEGPVYEKDAVIIENVTKPKYKGGPVTPFGRLRATLCHHADIVLRITLKGHGAAGGLGLPSVNGANGATPGPAPLMAPPLPLGLPGATPAVAPVGASVASAVAPSGPARWVEREYWTEAHPQWHTKFFDFGISYKEKLGLRRMLERAGVL